MLKAKDIMSTDVVTLTPDTDIATAAKLLVERHINGVPVINEDGSLAGVLCQSDLVAQQKSVRLPSLFTLLDGYIAFTSNAEMEKEISKISATKVEQAMTVSPKTITPEATIEDIANLMINKKLYTLPVIENKKLIGIVGKEDILKVLTNND
ncbi:CBS domain-containing protein [Maridesulfovibrio bastinii]|uniref:CBS domain-containing protein n=1 Tax=Maridesulfovibrio bastinii TaxID=47157 RepID=UPI0004090D7B|nr:CBS domain-containing protein [Maridesulfovibrio bastinii]